MAEQTSIGDIGTTGGVEPELDESERDGLASSASVLSEAIETVSGT